MKIVSIKSERPSVFFLIAIRKVEAFKNALSPVLIFKNLHSFMYCLIIFHLNQISVLKITCNKGYTKMSDLLLNVISGIVKQKFDSEKSSKWDLNVNL